MPKPDKLFELINSLDKSERSWISKCLRAFKQNNSLILFEYLEQQESYDKETLLQDLRHESLIKYLSVQKNNLYSSILKYLRLLSEEKGSHYELWNDIIDYSLLSEKGLQHHVFSKLEKSSKLAKKEAQYHQYLKLLSLKRDALVQHSSPDIMDTIDELVNINDDFESFLELIDEVWKYRFWSAIIKKLIKSASVSKTNEQEEKRLFEAFNCFLAENSLPKNPIALFYYYQVHILFYTYQKDYLNAFTYIQKQIDCIDSLSINTPNTQRNKVSIYINAVVVGTLTKQPYQNIANLIRDTNEMLQAPVFKPILGQLLNEFYYHQLNYYNYKGYFKHAYQLLETIKECRKIGILKYSPAINLAIAGYHFVNDDAQAALDFIDKVLMLPKKEVSPKIHYNTALMRILIQLDENNLFFAESLFRRFNRFLKKEGFTSIFSNKLSKFLSKFIKLRLEENKQQLMKCCKNYLNSLQEFRLEDIKHVNFLNIAAWVNTQIKGVSLQESIQFLHADNDDVLPRLSND